MARILSELIYKLTADDKELTKKLKDVEKRVDATAKRFTQFGKALTIGVTLPIVAAGTAAVKFASDTRESLNAVNVVFGESAQVITDWSENAAEQVGLTRAEYNQFGAVIGAVLKDSGVALDTAAGQTNNLLQRSADLASIFNTDVDEALTALRAGLVGESEPLRRFSIFLTEAAVNARAVELGIAASASEVDQAAKIQARYSLIMEKSDSFAGDFANTSGELANSTRILNAQIKEAAAELGEELLPIVLEVVTFLRDLVQEFRSLDEEQRRTVLQVAAVVAAIGPLLTVVGKVLPLINQVKAAFTALGAAGGPIAIATAAIVALIAAAATLDATMRNSALESFAESLPPKIQQLRENLELTNEQFYDLSKNLLLLSKNTSGNVAGQFEEIARNAGVTTAELLQVVESSEKLQASFGDTLDATRSIAQEAELFRQRQEAIENTESRRAAQEAELARIIEEEQNAALARQRELLAQIEDRYKDGAARIQDIIDSSRTELKVLQDEVALISSFDWGAGPLQDRRNLAISILNEEIAKVEEEKEAVIQAEQDKLAEEQRAADLRLAERLQASAEVAEAQRQADEEEQKRIEKINKLRIEGARTVYNELTGFADAFFQFEIDQIEASGKSEKEKAVEVAKIKRKQAVVNKVTASIETGIAGAQAAIQAFAQLGPIGGAIAAAVIAGITATKIGFILAQPLPEIPSFQTGGVIPGTSFTGDSIMARVNSGEEIVTRDDPRNIANQDSEPRVFQFIVNRRVLAELVAEEVGNGTVKFEVAG